MAGLTKEQRAAMMADSADGAEPIDLPETIPAAKPQTAPVAAVVPPPPAPATTDMAALIQAFTNAMTQSNKESAMAARNPIPESYLNGGFPEKSVFSHPDGDLAHPPTKLKCPMFMGIYGDDGIAKSAFEIFEASCTEKERLMLNELTPGVFPVERNDGRTANWRVVLQKDDLGEPIRLVIAVPSTWLSKEQQAQMPGQPNFLKQLTQPAA